VSITTFAFHQHYYLLVFSHSGILLLALDLIAEFKSLPLWPIAGVPYGHQINRKSNWATGGGGVRTKEGVHAAVLSECVELEAALA
jgi:hypothetical protein